MTDELLRSFYSFLQWSTVLSLQEDSPWHRLSLPHRLESTSNRPLRMGRL